MDTKQTRQLVQQAYQLYLDKDVKGLLALIKDDVEWIGTDSDFVPFAGRYSGKDQVAQFFRKLDEAQEVIKFEPQAFICEGDQVAVTGISRWHVKSTGQDYDNPWAHVFTVRDGKIARFQQYNHTAAAEAAFRPGQGAGTAKGAPLRH